MFLKKFWKEAPKIPLTALIFHIIITILWMSKIIPPPSSIFVILENLYNNFGYLGLFIATFLEGIVYLGLYFPGSSIVALAVFVSDGKFLTLLSISILVAITLTITSFVNYFLGRHISFKKEADVLGLKKSSKNLIFSIIHPNILAFYFFNEGYNKKSLMKIILVPFLMIPYGLVFAYMLYFLSAPIKSKLDSPYFIALLILFWIIIAFIMDHKKKVKEEIKRLEKVI